MAAKPAANPIATLIIPRVPLLPRQSHPFDVQPTNGDFTSGLGPQDARMPPYSPHRATIPDTDVSGFSAAGACPGRAADGPAGADGSVQLQFWYVLGSVGGVLRNSCTHYPRAIRGRHNRRDYDRLTKRHIEKVPIARKALARDGYGSR
jgi:hypothetical protein